MADPIRFWVLKGPIGLGVDRCDCPYAFSSESEAADYKIGTQETIEMVEAAPMRERIEKLEKALGAIRDSPVHHRMGRTYADEKVFEIAEEALKP